MKKKAIVCGIIILILTVSLCGCEKSGKNEGKDEEGTARESLWKAAPENSYAILINMPDAEQEKALPASEKLILDQGDERFLLIPAKSVDTVTIWSLDTKDPGFPRYEAVYVNKDVGKDFILDLVAVRPEGEPRYQLSLDDKKGSVNYYISYNGKEGSPNIEYIVKE